MAQVQGSAGSASNASFPWLTSAHPQAQSNNISRLAAAKALACLMMSKGLVPRDVLQTQRETPAHRIAGDYIEASKVSENDLAERLRTSTFWEIEHNFSPPYPTTPGTILFRVLFQQLDFHDELRIGLIGRVLPKAFGLNPES